jgi:rsbT antagonist protein RsbS
MHEVDNTLFVSLDANVNEDYVQKLGNEILKKIDSDSIRNAVIDFSTVMVLDSYNFSKLKKIAQMISTMGVNVVLVGIQAGVAAALVDLDVNLDDICTAVTMEDGIAIVEKRDNLR